MHLPKLTLKLNKANPGNVSWSLAQLFCTNIIIITYSHMSELVQKSVIMCLSIMQDLTAASTSSDLLSRSTRIISICIPADERFLLPSFSQPIHKGSKQMNSCCLKSFTPGQTQRGGSPWLWPTLTHLQFIIFLTHPHNSSRKKALSL